MRWCLRACLLPVAVSTLPAASTLEFSDRVAAQEAIERATYSHRIGATRPFEVAVPREVLEEKVRTYLRESEALEEICRTPVTGEMLRAELERIARDTRFPERLLEIYHALGDDAFLVPETFARASLVDRLGRGFFAGDRRIHASAWMRAEAIRGDLTSGALDPRSPHPDRAAYRASRGGGAAWTVAREISGCDPSSCGAAPGELGDEAGLAALRAELPASRGEVAALREAEDAYSVSVLLETGDDRLAWADFSVPRVSWREWWAGVESTLDGAAIHAVARADAALPLPARPGTGEGLALDGGAIEDAVAASGATAIPANMWANSTLDDPPAPRAEHSAVWTGTEFLVWGGYASRLPTNTGARYEPLTDTWRSTSTLGAPVARARHTAVWTGSVMLVWGGVGLNGVFRLQSGGRYDPSLDRWLPTSETGAPSARDSHAAAWTGSRMLVWGGWTGAFPDSMRSDTGAQYDPLADAWFPMATAGAPAARSGFSALWTGARLLVWGGEDGAALLDDGGSYDPAADAWARIARIGAPAPRYGHTATGDATTPAPTGGARCPARTPRAVAGRIRPSGPGRAWSSGGAVARMGRCSPPGGGTTLPRTGGHRRADPPVRTPARGTLRSGPGLR